MVMTLFSRLQGSFIAEENSTHTQPLTQVCTLCPCTVSSTTQHVGRRRRAFKDGAIGLESADFGFPRALSAAATVTRDWYLIGTYMHAEVSINIHTYVLPLRM